MTSMRSATVRPSASPSTTKAESPLAPGPSPVPSFVSYDSQRLQLSGSLELMPRTQPALVLSPTQATVLTVVLILLLAISFGAGLLVGRFYLG